MSLELIRSFGVASFLGLPAAGLRRFGVPPGGAFDVESFSLACALAGIDLSARVWELSMAQATFRIGAPGVVGIAGASAAVRFGGLFESNVAFSVSAGEEFTVEAPSAGSRVYVAFGATIRSSRWSLRLDELPDSVAHRNVLRVVPGPQAASFDLGLLGKPFLVSRTGNRVGVRLEPSVGAHAIELPSEPQCVGAIQVSNDGTPIALGPDGPTIGGYPKIAVIASCDIGRLGQLSPGDPVRFEVVSVEAARQLAIAAQATLDRRVTLLHLAK